MKSISICFMVLLISLVIFNQSLAQNSWTMEWLLGDAYCFPTPLTIYQEGFNDIKLITQYNTNSFQLPVYYSIKLSCWKGSRAWEIELIHLKIQLKNKPPEIQRFEISHGYNFIFLNKVLAFKEFIFRTGIGTILAHPENTIRGKILSETKGILNKGYYLSGIAVQFGLGKCLTISHKLLFTLEGKITTAYSKVPVVTGKAMVPLIAIHGLLGLRYKF